MLAGRFVLVHPEDFHQVGVVHGHAGFAFALEQLDAVLVIGPLAPQHLDGDDAAVVGIVGAEDTAEAAGGDFVQQPIAADEVAVGFSLGELAALEGRQIAFALEYFEQRLGRAAAWPSSTYAC